MSLVLFVRRRRLCLAALLACQAFGAHAIEQRDLQWDLSYRAARAAHRLDAKEFMAVWPTTETGRPVFGKLAAYRGAPIEASLLIESLDGHAGDASTTWIVKTGDGAFACSFHPKVMDQPCTSLDPAKAEQAIRDIARMRPLPPLFDTPARRQARKEDPDGPRMNYVGFLSLYVDGAAQQRPIHIMEYMPPGDAVPGIAAAEVARLARALARLALSPEAFREQEQELARQDRGSALDARLRAGDVEAVRAMLDDPMHQAPLAGALGAAVSSGSEALVALLLARGTDINAGEADALQAAVASNNAAMVTFLVKRGARPDPLRRHPRVGPINSPLTLAAKSGRHAMARLLLTHGANPNLEQSSPPLPAAAYALDLPMVELLLDAGARPDQTSDGKSALVLLAGAFGDNKHANPAIERIVRRLVEAGADINFTTPICQTALSFAQEQSKGGRLAHLIESLGADPHAGQRCDTRLKRGFTNVTASAEAVARAALASTVRAHLQDGDVAALERLYRTVLEARERTPSGVWKLALFYAQLREHARASHHDSYVASLLALGAAWQRSYPASTPARLLQVYTQRARAQALREADRTAALTLEQKLVIGVSRGAARSMLDEAKAVALAAGDPEWYRAALVGLADEETLSPASARALLREGAARYPNYHELYFAAAYLAYEQRKRGLDGPAVIARAAGKGGDPEHASLYARVLWAAAALEYAPDPFAPGQAVWPLAHASFQALLARYPDPRNLNAYAYFSCLARDYATTARLLEQLGDELDFSAWGQQGRQAYSPCAMRAAEARSATAKRPRL